MAQGRTRGAEIRVKPNSKIKILVVEDDLAFQRALQERLGQEGYQVWSAADGREGMKAIVTFSPDLVISDWIMPHMDGLELCQAVKTGLRESAPYFILLTARGEISDRLLGLDTGADDYLVKPCDQGELLARVRAGLRNVLLTRELCRAATELKLARAELGTARAGAGRPSDLLPMCLFCRKVRTPEGSWLELYAYLAEHALIDFGHGICPQCDSSYDPSLEALSRLDV